MVFVSALLVINAGSREHAVRVHPRRRRHPAGPPGDGLLPARVRRLRSGRAAGRGDPRPEAQHPSGDRLVGDPDRDLLRLLLLRGDRLLRPGQDGRLHRRQRGQSVGRHGRGGPAGHRQPPGHVRDPQQLPGQRELGRQRVDAFGLRARAVAAHPRRLRDGPSDPSDAGDRRSTSRRSSGSSSPSASACTSGNQYPDVPGPLNTYFTIGYAIGLSFAAMYMAVNLATIGYFWREQRAEFNWFKHLIVPIIGFIADDPGLLRRPRRGHAADPRSRAGAADRAVLVHAAARRHLDGHRHRHRALLLVTGAGQAQLGARGDGRDRRRSRRRRPPRRRPEPIHVGCRHRLDRAGIPRSEAERDPHADRSTSRATRPTWPGTRRSRRSRRCRRATSSGSTASTRRTGS